MKTPGLAHVAYVIGDRGEAAVVDPRRDIDAYLRVAAAQQLRITSVIVTHRQEDFVLGSAALARATGAKVITGEHPLFGHGDIRLGDGDELTVAGIRLRALHTPGHTPESTCYALFVPEAPDLAWGVLTGDTLFVGETGRTDLPDPLRTGENAGQLYDAVHRKLVPLGDQALVLPAHGAGSVCGAGIVHRDESTLGLERRYNPVFTLSRDDFMRVKVDERIPRPPYFDVMEQVNLEGGAPLARPAREVPWMPVASFAADSGDGIVIDTRSPEAFAAAHVPGSYSIWGPVLSSFAGWIARPETRVYLVLSEADDLEEAVLALYRVGIDRVEGALAGGFSSWRGAGMPLAHARALGPRELHDNLGEVRVLDVRDDGELASEGHIPQAMHLYVGYLEHHLDRLEPPLDPDEPLVVTCSAGYRSGLATSILQRKGFRRVHNLLGGMTAWRKLHLPRERTRSHPITTPDIEGARQ